MDSEDVLSPARLSSLEKVLTRLESLIIPGNFRSKLSASVEGGFLTPYEEELVFCKPTDIERVRELFRVLKGKCNGDFDKFCAVLESDTYGHWAKELRKEAGERYDYIKDSLSRLPEDVHQVLQSKKAAFVPRFDELKEAYIRVINLIEDHVTKLAPSEFTRCVRSFNDDMRCGGKCLTVSEMLNAHSFFTALSAKEWYTPFNLEALDSLVKRIPAHRMQSQIVESLERYRLEQLRPCLEYTFLDLSHISEIVPADFSEELSLALIVEKRTVLKSIEDARQYLLSKLSMKQVQGLKFDSGCFIVYFDVVYESDLRSLSNEFLVHGNVLLQLGIQRVFLLGYWGVDLIDESITHFQSEKTQFQLLKDNFNFKSFILDNVQGPGRLVGESGRYSEVREVVWHGLPVAAKEFTGDKYKARQCIREIYTWAPALRHTNIVQFFGLWEKNGSDSLPLIVMELLPCHLASFLNRWYILKDDRRFSVARNFILLDVSRGMAYLHSQNIMHRNLKAKSILLASNLVAKVGDFGTARFFDTEEKGKLTTPEDSNDVLPPEAYTKYYGLEVDRFSFGCVMIHCLIHKRPAPNSCEKLNPYQQRKHLTEDVLPDLYTKFQPIIKRCLDEIPENRISFPEIVEELCSIVSGAERSRSENILDTVVINLCSSNQQTIQSIKVNDDAIDSMESEKQLLDDYSVHGSVVPVVKKTDVSEKEDFLLGQRSLMILGISVSIVVLVIAVYFG